MYSESDVIEFVKSTEEFKSFNYKEMFINRMECKLFHFRSNCPAEIHYKDEYFDLEDYHTKNNSWVSSEEDEYMVVLDKGKFRLYAQGDDDKEWFWVVSIPVYDSLA